MKKNEYNTQPEPETAPPKRPYERPRLERVDLALDETLSAGCKLAGTCDLPPFPVSDGGS
jgi:hypothetical protein